ncbi:sodium-and chloride-dependent glycine transporter 2 [Elysia marginata]|uniref:Sodium-and chloride-dependent glycine transporter 2 n=1 Tax=Elysia marginata TaxID=1093978 RepID=A0AAV4H3W0_9GAST|nr:sodium-and chloride-dependent glycine transporter 2 [Elysia marginata]
MTSAFVDEYPRFLRKKKVLFTAFMCFVEFCIGIPMVFEGGVFLLTLMDWYSSCFSLMLLSLTECLVITWIYGVDRFMKDIELMIGRRPSTYWKYMWKFFTPAIVLFIWTFSLHQMKRVKLDTYRYPDWSIVLGWGFALCSVIPLPICATVAIYQEKSGTFVQKILKLIQPAANFGPSQAKDKERYLASLDEFDWLRLKAVRAGLDWRTYKRMQTNGATGMATTNDSLATTVNMSPCAPLEGDEQTLQATAPGVDPPPYGVWLTNESAPAMSTNHGLAAAATTHVNSQDQSDSKC